MTMSKQRMPSRRATNHGPMSLTGGSILLGVTVSCCGGVVAHGHPSRPDSIEKGVQKPSRVRQRKRDSSWCDVNDDD